jgi:hypothetical protein
MSYNYDRLLNAGISFEHAQELRRISMTLHRWYELECGDGNDYASWCITRGKKTGKVFEYDDAGKPYIERHMYRFAMTSHGQHDTTTTYTLIADRERGALKRLAAIMANYPKLNAYLQTDPRGCALYIGENLTDTNYNQGIAVYK